MHTSQPEPSSPTTLLADAYTITARFTQQGLHRWPTAPERRAYLRSPHRHLFAVSVQARLDHPEREVEFHDLADRAHTHMAALGVPYHPDAPLLLDFGPRSCEALAREVALSLRAEGYVVERVTVSEDGENDGVWSAVSAAHAAQQKAVDLDDLGKVAARVAEGGGGLGGGLAGLGHGSIITKCTTTRNSPAPVQPSERSTR